MDLSPRYILIGLFGGLGFVELAPHFRKLAEALLREVTASQAEAKLARDFAWVVPALDGLRRYK